MKFIHLLPLSIFLYTYSMTDYYFVGLILVILHLLISMGFFYILLMSYATLNTKVLKEALSMDIGGSLKKNMKRIMEDNDLTFAKNYSLHFILFLLFSSAFKLIYLDESLLVGLILTSVVFQLYNSVLYGKLSKFYYENFKNELTL